MKRINYRWLWEKEFGPIPKEPNGRSYQLHHIDGNAENNNFSNLLLVTLDEHIEIHRKQGDDAAVMLLENMRGNTHSGWKHSDDTKKKISETQKQKYKSGERIHPMLGKKRPDLVERNKLGASDETKQKMREAKLKNPTNYWLGKSRKGLIVNHPTLTCPHCGKVGKGTSAMERWHFDNCKNIK
jgi:hypothetical protein